jgi:DNA-binding GntR family transcriptional regulator
MIQLKPLAQAPFQSATDLVFESLYVAVVQLDLPPGTRLSEAEVAERLGVSRQPVRDAFFRLASRGFLLIRPQRATLVTRISEAEVLRAAFIRIALETACLRAAADRVTQADITRLRGLLASQAEAAARQDAPGFHALDEAFHADLCAIAGQPRVWDLIQEQKGHMDRARFLSLSFNQRAAQAEHVAILDALEAGATTLAVERLDMHLGKICAHLPQIRASHPDHFDETPR